MESGGGVDDADAVEAVFIKLGSAGDHKDVAGAFAFDDLEAFPSKDVAGEEVVDFGDLLPRARFVFILTRFDEGFTEVGRKRADSIGKSRAIHAEIGFGKMATKNVPD